MLTNKNCHSSIENINKKDGTDYKTSQQKDRKMSILKYECYAKNLRHKVILKLKAKRLSHQ
jgi:hypothetical protein